MTCTKIRDRCACSKLKHFVPIWTPPQATFRWLPDRFSHVYWSCSATECFRYLSNHKSRTQPDCGPCQMCIYSLNLDREYMIDHFVRHVGNGANRIYFVRCYRFTAGDDTMEPSVKISPTYHTLLANQVQVPLVKRLWQDSYRTEQKWIVNKTL